MGNSNRKMGNSNSNKKPISSPSQSTTKFDLNKLRSELECCICLSLFEEPKQLQCGHVYCAACVQGLIDAMDRKALFITCPKCRKLSSKVPANGQFPTAFEIKNLVSYIKEAEAAQSKKEKAIVTGQCSACHKFAPGQEFSLTYMDANETLRLDPGNLVEKARRELALDWMGMTREPQKKHEMADIANTKEESFNASWPTNLRISTLSLTSADYVEDSNPVVVCTEAGGAKLRIPLCQLDQFLNEHVDGPVSRFVFKFVKFDEQLVQMLRRVKRERFQRVDRDGVVQMNIDWENCDFSRISETSFHFLLDVLFCPEIFSIAAPGRRRLDLVDGHLHDGFDSFFDRLVDRFDQDTQSRCSYFLVILLLNATNKTKERLKLGQLQVLEHPKNNSKLEYKLRNPTVGRSLKNPAGGRSYLFEFHAKRY